MPDEIKHEIAKQSNVIGPALTCKTCLQALQASCPYVDTDRNICYHTIQEPSDLSTIEGVLEVADGVVHSAMARLKQMALLKSAMGHEEIQEPTFGELKLLSQVMKALETGVKLRQSFGLLKEKPKEHIHSVAAEGAAAEVMLAEIERVRSLSEKAKSMGIDLDSGEVIDAEFEEVGNVRPDSRNPETE